MAIHAGAKYAHFKARGRHRRRRRLVFDANVGVSPGYIFLAWLYDQYLKKVFLGRRKPTFFFSYTIPFSERRILS